ncbi:hypothetical protein BSKO_00313 [Bryopsis sp. KO-2023]|nr:hypothetical protein BSKO_00313 [Bryopsis sp. KO-2023]
MADEERGEANPQPPPRRSARFDCFLFVCRVLNIATGVCALLCLIAHGMAFVAGDALFQSYDSMKRQTLRIFGILFSALVALVETEWETFLVQLRLLDGWSLRGLFQLFLGILTLELATSKGDHDFDKSVNLYGTVSGISLICCAGVYFLGGMLCFGKIKRAWHRKIGQRAAEKGRLEKDLQALQSKQTELQGLLSRYANE